MTLLFIRQQGNGPERNANLIPRGVFPAGVSPDGDAPREKGCRIRSGPFLEMLPMKRRKTMDGGIVRVGCSCSLSAFCLCCLVVLVLPLVY